MTTPSIIVALDYPDRAGAEALAARLDPALCRVKVGKELFTREGPAVVRGLVGAGFEVFLDLKFHDIPNTVAAAVSAAADLGVWMLTLHAGGGPAMMAGARAALAERGGAGPRLVAVTVLTSMDDAQLAATGVAGGAAAQVSRLARLARDNGMDGVVCSAREAATLRGELGADFLLVTPGIRPAGSDAGDQARVATPAAARAAGADHLVVGRPITRAVDPLVALRAIAAELAGD